MTIVYESNTGFTERYAKTLSEKTGIEALPLKSAKKAVPKGNDVVFLGWVMANKVSGLDTAQRLWNIAALAPVGMNPLSEQNDKALIAANKIECPMFYLPGGLNIKKLDAVQRIMLNMVRSNLEKQNRPEYKDAIEMLKNGGDWFSEEYLSDLITLILAKL